MKCLSLFSGAGGLDLGVEAAGFNVISSIEQDKDCCDTLRANGKRGIVQADTSSVDYRALAKKHQIDLLIGGPPCQPFSKSALWTGAGTQGLLDPRSDTIGDYCTAIKELRPRAFILENVEGFARWGGLKLVEEEIASLSANGASYSLSSAILNAADYGVPQKRKRFFLVGILNGPKFVFPKRTHGAGLISCTTAWDACASVSGINDEQQLDVKGRWAPLLPSIPPGSNYLWHTRKGGGLPIFGWRTRFWSFLFKLDPMQPSPTIVANPSQNSGPFHWENRLLRVAELAALQTFPPAYRFCGERASRQRQVGNAVPPLMAELIARSLASQLGRAVPKKVRYQLAAAVSQPKAVLPATVPIQFLSHVGEHADHPGAGLGPRPRVIPTQQEEASYEPS